MEQLEGMKATAGLSGAQEDELYMENFALKIFAKADKCVFSVTSLHLLLHNDTGPQRQNTLERVIRALFFFFSVLLFLPFSSFFFLYCSTCDTKQFRESTKVEKKKNMPPEYSGRCHATECAVLTSPLFRPSFPYHPIPSHPVPFPCPVLI